MQNASFRRKWSPIRGAASRYQASKSHTSNDAYMKRFEATFKNLQSLHLETKPSSSVETEYKGPATAPSLHNDDADSSLTHTEVQSTIGIDPNPETSIDISSLPLLCSSVDEQGDEIAVGSADHGVYVVDLVKKRVKRTLFTKRHGHSEWVTCVTHADDGRIVSGGMDSKLCLWHRESTTCLDLIGHQGSISGVQCNGEAIVSGSYDKTVRIWNGRTGMGYATLAEHSAPILDLISGPAHLMATRDRGGSAIVWDIASAALVWRLKKIHKGHVTAMEWISSDATKDGHQFMTGGQDGFLRMWDLRDRVNVFKERVHGVRDTAAVNEILIHPTNTNLLITCGADKSIKVWDRRDACASSLWEVGLLDFPYSAGFFGRLLICSGGDGSLLVLDVESLDVKQMINTQQHAMQFIHAISNQLVCGGDAGNLFLYNARSASFV